MKIKAIITGTTGMVGEGVLHECLQHPEVASVLAINRKPCGVQHPKLTEIIHNNFFDLSAIADRLSGYNACYFCLGVSSVGMKEEIYRHLTYDLTIYMAGILASRNPDMTFCYVSGAGTDSTEQGRSMWARVKGKTENDLRKLAFKAVYLFRPGYIQPTKGLRYAHRFYYAFSWLYPVWKLFFRNYVCTLAQIGLAMIAVSRDGYDKQIIHVKDMLILSARARH
ncbi:Rossmann-fold NAD(P)-binding domain-containing protein [Chitinophaga vietnamensis]|uniref:epimerase n=1 Tax=Chitinophaga vietnamensis TaxID=2593957 RepID=UPI001177732B|nr:epimerase [Chitinophaga vietnamensis]